MKQKFITYLGIFLVLISVTSCKVGPNYKKPEIASPEIFSYENNPVDSIINLKWWELFQDPILDTLIATALRENKDVLIAASRVEEARANLGFTKAGSGPKIGVQAGAGGSNFNGANVSNNTYNSFGTSATFNWEIDFWGKYRRSTEAAKASMLGSFYGKRAVEVGLISEIARNYFQLINYKTSLEVSENTLKIRENALKIIQSRFDIGYTNIIDVNQAQIQKARLDEIENYKLHYEDRGSGDIVFLLHGWYQSANECFAGYIDHFAEKYRVIAVDLPGHGKSSKNKTDHYSLPNSRESLIRFLETLTKDTGPVKLIGCSLGAYIGLQIAIERPDLVESLVLISTFLDFRQDELEMETMLKLSTPALRWTLWKRSRRGQFPFESRRSIHWSVKGKKPNKYRHYKQKMENHPAYAALGYIKSFLRSSVMERFTEINLPTLIIYGRHDSLTPHDFATSLARKMPRAKLHIVERAGHNVYLTHPKKVCRLTSEFLQENKKRKFQWMHLFGQK